MTAQPASDRTLSLAPPADWGMETSTARARRERAEAILAPLIEHAANENTEPGARLGAWAKLKASACDLAELLHVAGSESLEVLGQ